MQFWQFCYNIIVVPVGWLYVHALALFKQKVRRGIRGRKNLFENLERQVQTLSPNAKRVWFHSSSMGEFEQAKPIIAALKKKYPEVEIIVSFFSPSGYDNSKTYKLARIITYLPFDSKANAERFVSIIKPDAAVMVRYDLWPNHLWSLQKAGVPIIIANATFRDSWIKHLPFIKSFLFHTYNAIDDILTVSAKDREGFKTFQLPHPQIEVVGDTRFDQVWQRSAESKARHLLPPKVIEGKKIFVVGSSWQEDEEVLFPAMINFSGANDDFFTILVPHEPDERALERIEFHLNGKLSHIRFSELNDYVNERVIIVDSIGILMTLYRYGYVSYVGGSFRQGIHNVLEPAVYGQPLLIGPKHENSQEAITLVKDGVAFIVNTPGDVEARLRELFNNEQQQQSIGKQAQEFVRQYVGATEHFLSRLEKVL